MQKPLNHDIVAGTSPISPGRVCPRCQGNSYPVKRGFFNRIIGHESIMYRYQCDSYRCSDREYEYGERPLTGDIPADMKLDTSGCICPRCGGASFRIERRLIDLFISRFSLVHRYQCDSRLCGWTGLVRQEQHTNSARN